MRENFQQRKVVDIREDAEMYVNSLQIPLLNLPLITESFTSLVSNVQIKI